MFKEERQQQIIEILNERHFASVNKLSELLYVSLPTVRRDLCELEKRGMIVRNHGGAMSISNGSYETPLEFRSGYNMSAKQSICKKAAKLISDGDVIFVDASSSAMNIANYIEKKNVTAVTNGLYTAIQLTKKNIKTYFIGGEILLSSFGTAGKYAEKFALQFNYDLVFFSSSGINDKGMIVDVSLAETELRKEIFKNAKKKVFLIDKSKENIDAPYNLIAASEVEVIISE